jgi:UDP-GlcNAc3NAcA epimerase
MKILTLIGARPQFVKAAVVSKAFLEEGITELIVHSGQHYDEKMSAIFWEELNIPKPFCNLQIGSANHGEQTGSIMIQLERLITNEKNIDAILVYGDTNTTLAGALVGSKLHIPIIHIESGLRSYNRQMPEEVNRVLTDAISNVLFCPSQIAIDNLVKEGITNNVFNVGDVMWDAVKTFTPIAKKSVRLRTIIKHDNYTLLTLHRPSNTDDLINLNSIISQLAQLNTNIYWPVHPRNIKHLSSLNLPTNLHLLEPLSYFEMLIALENCNHVITDSGGLQKEAYWNKKPCTTIRPQTEWIETLKNGWNILASPQNNEIVDSFLNRKVSDWVPLYGNGEAAKKIALILKHKYDSKD